VIGRPQADEAAPYYFTYIDKVPDDPVVSVLERQLNETLPLLANISEEKSLCRYAPDKWSIRQTLNHITDAERVFLYRALWFGRGFDSALPSFDQTIAAAGAQADRVAWADHVREFRGMREATISFFRNLPEEGWGRKGVANGNVVTVRALAYIIAGHLEHHGAIIRERYL
jgi:uncharacterized damage-inducible protein DinB